MSSAVGTALFAATATLLLGSCRYHAPSAEFLGQLVEVHRNLQCEIEASLDGVEGGGEFQGALVVETGHCARVRLKLFPDLGSAALDLVATPDHVEALSSFEDGRFVTRLPPEGDPGSSLSFLLAVTLLEHFAGIPPQRVAGVRAHELGTRVKLRPHSSGISCRAVLDPSGRVLWRDFYHGFVRWRLEVEPHQLRLVARDASLTIVFLDVVELDELPDALFELEDAPGA